MLIDYGCGEREARFSVLTLVIYEQQFGSDMIADVFGRVESGGEREGVIFDYSSIRWTACLRALWAGLRTAEETGGDKVPPFEEWAASASGVDCFDVFRKVRDEATSAFFRPAPAAAPEGRKKGGQR